MESLISVVTEFWNTLALTLWLVLGLSISFSFHKNVLF